MKQVVVCPEPLAAEAGAEILRAGGSAVDAAIAGAYVQTVVSPAMASIAGAGVMNVFHAPSRQHVILDFLGYAGSGATENMFLGRPESDCVVGYHSINVPTFVRGTYAAFEQFGSGRVSWEALLSPAIRHAEDGFHMDPYTHQYWRADNPVQQSTIPFDGYTMLSTTQPCAVIFTVDGRVHHIGERVVQRDLAYSLRRLATACPEDFYTGELGRRIGADLEKHGAPVTIRDLEASTFRMYEPARGTYRGLTVTTDPFPNVGIFLLEVLNMMECEDLSALDSLHPDYFRLIGRALSHAFRDRAALLERHATDAPSSDHLGSKEYARNLWATASPIGTHGHVGRSSLGTTPGTTQVSTLDKEGSAVSLTHSIGMGSGVVTPGLGFIYNNQMQGYDRRPGRINSIAPGRHQVTGGGPAIVLQDGRVRYVLGSPHGFKKTSSMSHTIISLVDFHMSAGAAVSSPRIHCEDDPNVLIEDTFIPLPVRTREDLRSSGCELRQDLYGGRVCLIEADWTKQWACGASDPRGGGGLVEV